MTVEEEAGINNAVLDRTVYCLRERCHCNDYKFIMHYWFYRTTPNVSSPASFIISSHSFLSFNISSLSSVSYAVSTGFELQMIPFDKAFVSEETRRFTSYSGENA